MRKIPHDVNERDRTRFWLKVAVGDPDKCWPYTQYCDKDGYGQFWLQGAQYRAHSVAYTLIHGAIGESASLILHRCDNPPCCNPSHLVAGTQADNHADRGEKNRQAKGRGIASAKLTEAKVREMRRRVAEGEAIRAVARRFGVSQRTTQHIIRRVWWKHVE